MCMECRQNPCHPRCPNAHPEVVGVCKKCKEEITRGEMFVEDTNGNIYCEYCVDDMTPREVMEICGESFQVA